MLLLAASPSAASSPARLGRRLGRALVQRTAGPAAGAGIGPAFLLHHRQQLALRAAFSSSSRRPRSGVPAHLAPTPGLAGMGPVSSTSSSSSPMLLAAQTRTQLLQGAAGRGGGYRRRRQAGGAPPFLGLRSMGTTSGSVGQQQQQREEDEEDKAKAGRGKATTCCDARPTAEAPTAGKEGESSSSSTGGSGGGLMRNRALLEKFTVAASILCAIDCTVFPALLTILPALEMLDVQALGWDLHAISHGVALYVVMPIGTTTTLSNYLLHKDKPLAALSVAGLCLIFGSNYPLDFLPAALYESRLYNTLGCAMLIGSSYLAHRSGGNHHHHHDHDHGHGHDHGDGKDAGKEGAAAKEEGQGRCGGKQ